MIKYFFHLTVEDTTVSTTVTTSTTTALPSTTTEGKTICFVQWINHKNYLSTVRSLIFCMKIQFNNLLRLKGNDPYMVYLVEILAVKHLPFSYVSLKLNGSP